MMPRTPGAASVPSATDTGPCCDAGDDDATIDAYDWCDMLQHARRRLPARGRSCRRCAFLLVRAVRAGGSARSPHARARERELRGC